MSIPTFTIPCGNVAPGNTCPPLVVPMNKFTRLAGSEMNWLCDAEARVKTVTKNESLMRKDSNIAARVTGR